MGSTLRKAVRGATSCALFGLFGLGALALAPVMLVLRRPHRAQPVVRSSWLLIVALFRLSGLIGVERGDLPSPRGTILVANHPSLIDVVLLTVLVPHTLYVAKSSLLHNVFLSAIVRATALPQSASLVAAAAPYLERGWNVLVFPEGTRSPASGGLGAFHRGAAQLALRTRAPLLSVGVALSRRLLAKRQAAWDMGERRVVFRFRAGAPRRVACAPGESLHVAANRVTAALRAEIGELCR